MSRREILRAGRVARVDRAIDHIRMNLAGDLSLQALARVASFSPYHFHRLFRSVTGETVNGFIRRVRVETAAVKLLHQPTLSISQIGVECGFGSSSSFAREFRTAFGMSASQFRDGGFREWDAARALGSKDGQGESKGGKAERKAREDPERAGAYTPPETGTRETRRTPMKIQFEVKEMPALHVAYVRHTGPYHEIGEAFDRLGRWAGPRGFYAVPGALVLGVYHDDPKVTEPSKLRSSACVTVPKGTKTDAEVGTMDIPGGRFAVAHCELGRDEFGAAWDKLIGEWIPRNGYQSDDRMCYEVYLNDPQSHPERKFVVDICEPVKPL